MQIGKYKYNRVNKSMNCPICGAEKWCMVSDDGTHVICPRTEIGSKKELKCGFLHKLGKDRPPVPKFKITKTKSHKPDYEYINKIYKSLDFSEGPAVQLAEILGIEPYSLRMLGMGKGSNYWAFPMFDEKRRVTGLKRRFSDGEKRCVKHSRLGLYYPVNFSREKPAVVCEGESDTAAMLCLGFNAIGRASANSCEDLLVKLLGNQETVIFSDNDRDGLRYAYRLMQRLPNSCVIPSKHGDARSWYISGEFDFGEYQKMVETAKKERLMFEVSA